MELTHRIENNICIVSITGHILHDKVETLRDYLDPWLKNETIDVILINLHKVAIIDSSGIAAIMITMKSLQEREANLILSNLDSQCQEILEVMGLNEVLNIFDTEEQALASLQ